MTDMFFLLTFIGMGLTIIVLARMVKNQSKELDRLYRHEQLEKDMKSMKQEQLATLTRYSEIVKESGPYGNEQHPTGSNESARI